MDPLLIYNTCKITRRSLTGTSPWGKHLVQEPRLTNEIQSNQRERERVEEGEEEEQERR